MKHLILSLSLISASSLLFAQPPEGPGGGGDEGRRGPRAGQADGQAPNAGARRGQPDQRPAGQRPQGQPRRPGHPLVVALDTDQNGVLSADEIRKASAALLTLDKNKDGSITHEEMRPSFARPGGGRPGGPEGGRPGGGRPGAAPGGRPQGGRQAGPPPQEGPVRPKRPALEE